MESYIPKVGDRLEYKAKSWPTGRWTKGTAKVIESDTVVVKTDIGKWNELSASQYDFRVIQYGLDNFLKRGLEIPGTTKRKWLTGLYEAGARFSTKDHPETLTGE